MIVCIMGVDPGLSGAVAFYFPEQNVVSVEDMPVVAGDIDVASFAALIAKMQPDIAVVELVGAMPKQGVASTFKFGCGYGMIRGVIGATAIPLHLVTPTKWKKTFSLDSDKDKARALALRYWPARSDLFGRKKDHGRAEAALIARYGAEKLTTCL
jgi:crossover junction endodeoxyribonuclease RuvC